MYWISLDWKVFNGLRLKQGKRFLLFCFKGFETRTFEHPKNGSGKGFGD